MINQNRTNYPSIFNPFYVQSNSYCQTNYFNRNEPNLISNFDFNIISEKHLIYNQNISPLNFHTKISESIILQEAEKLVNVSEELINCKPEDYYYSLGQCLFDIICLTNFYNEKQSIQNKTKYLKALEIQYTIIELMININDKLKDICK